MNAISLNPIAIVLLAVAAVSLLLVPGSWGAMGTFARIQYVAVIVAMVAFTAWLHYWNLLGFRV